MAIEHYSNDPVKRASRDLTYSRNTVARLHKELQDAELVMLHRWAELERLAEEAGVDVPEKHQR